MLLGLGDTNSVKSQIVATANQYGVDPNLALAVAKQESGYQQTNKSGGTLQSTLSNGQPGALGVFQLMPGTAAGLGVNPNDQAQNIDGGVRYLQQLLNQFNGDVPKALAAYNAGPGAVTKYGGVPPYPETQNYVKSIMANYQSSGGSSTSPVASPGQNEESIPAPSSESPTFPVSSPTEAFIDFSDPATMATVGVAGIAVLYLIFG